MCDKCGIPHENQEEFNKWFKDPANKEKVKEIVAKFLAAQMIGSLKNKPNGK